MKKVLCGWLLLCFFSLFNFLNVNALEIDGEKYRIEIINDYFEKEIYKDGFKLISKINKATSDLDKGIINVDITLDNYLDNEIVYVADNLSYFDFDSLKDKIKSNMNKEYVKQGVVITTKDNNFFTIDFDNMKTKIDEINSIEVGDSGNVFNAMEYATTLFTSNSNSKKSIVLIVNSLGNEDIQSLKNRVSDVISRGINLFVLRNNDSVNIDNYEEIFTNANYVCTDAYNSSYCKINSFDTNLALYPCYKGLGVFNMYFNNDIYNNFDLEFYHDGFAIYSYQNNKLKFDFFNGMEGYRLNIGEKNHLITYSLSLKNSFDKSLIGKVITTSDYIEGKFSNSYICKYKFNDEKIATYGGATYDDENFNLKDNLSFRLIKEETIVEEPKDNEIENPNTGMKEKIIIIGLGLFIMLILIKFKVKNKIMKI